MPTLAEAVEDGREVRMAQQRHLQLKERILPGIDVDAADLPGAIEQVVEGIAPGAGDHHHPAVAVQGHRLAVQPRILPAGIVDQVARVDAPEHPVVRPLQQASPMPEQPARSRPCGRHGLRGHVVNLAFRCLPARLVPFRHP